MPTHKPQWLLFASLMWICCLVGCGGAQSAKDASMPAPMAAGVPGYQAPAAEMRGPASGADEQVVAPTPVSREAPPMDTAKKSDSSSATTPTQPAPHSSTLRQILVYTAEVTMIVEQLDRSLALIESMARDMGGYLAERTDQQIRIRVPAAKFDDALARLSKLGDVQHQAVSVEDITEEFVDLTMRLDTARRVRNRLAQLLPLCKTVQESLQVERELARLNAEIETMEGRLKYLQDRAAYSTIAITLQRKADENLNLKANQATRLPFPWLQQLGLGRLTNLR